MSETITWGLHASAIPANTDEASLLLAGANEEYNGVLRIVNQDTTTKTYGLAHCAAAVGGALDKEWVAFPGTEVPAASPPHEYSIHLGNNEEIRIKSGTGDKVSFHITGEKKVTS